MKPSILVVEAILFAACFFWHVFLWRRSLPRDQGPALLAVFSVPWAIVTVIFLCFVKTDGVFVHIGMAPNSGLAPVEVQKNQFGEIIVDKNAQTNVSGLYAAGDVTDVPFKQIVVAAGQGTIAALSAVSYLNRIK